MDTQLLLTFPDNLASKQQTFLSHFTYRTEAQLLANTQCLKHHVKMSETTKGKAYVLVTKQVQSLCCKWHNTSLPSTGQLSRCSSKYSSRVFTFLRCNKLWFYARKCNLMSPGQETHLWMASLVPQPQPSHWPHCKRHSTVRLSEVKGMSKAPANSTGTACNYLTAYQGNIF